MAETDTTGQVPAGYTRYTAKDGTIYDFKGDNLPAAEVQSRVAKARGASPPAAAPASATAAPATQSFEHENARAMGLDPEKIERMQTDPEGKVHPGMGWLETGRQVLKGAGDFADRVIRDPYHLIDPIHALASGITSGAGLPDVRGEGFHRPNSGRLLGSMAMVLGGAEKGPDTLPEASAGARPLAPISSVPSSKLTSIGRPTAALRPISETLSPTPLPAAKAPVPTTGGPPPPVSSRYRLEIPGTMQDPNLLGPKGLGGIRVAPPVEPKLLPAPASEAAAAPTKLRYIRPAETPSMSGRGAAPAEMHPEELAEIRKESGRPNMSPEDAHAFRINRLAGKAAETAPKNDLGGMKRAGDQPEKLTPIDSAATAEPPTEPMQLKPIGERSLGEQAVKPKLENIINRAMGVKPLEPNVPLREQLGPAAEPGAEVDPMKVKYPDAKVRQLVRANGEEVYEAAKHDPDLLKQLHDLNRVDLRQALINAGEDMGQLTVSNSKFAGEGSIPREEAFHRLLAKGVKAADIPELAKVKE